MGYFFPVKIIRLFIYCASSEASTKSHAKIPGRKALSIGL